MNDEKLEYLVNEYSNHVLRLSYSYLKNIYDAQDIMQNVFEKLYTINPEFKDIKHEKAYILRMTSNACKNLLKSANRTQTTSIDLCEEIVAPEINDNSVLNSLNQLDEKYRIVIYLHYYEGYKAREIATILKIPTATVHTRLVRGRKNLELLLGGEE